MRQLRVRTAVTPLRRSHAGAPMPATLPTVDERVLSECPTEPMHCLRPAAIAAATHQFVAGFPGDVLYAVKCNPEPSVLRAVWEGDVRHFDCASAPEISLVRQMFPDAQIHFMHPVKSRPAIRDAYFRHDVRDFVLDSADELAKILHETEDATDLGLFVRLALPDGGAQSGVMYNLSGKFGASPDEAALLLRAVRARSSRIGLSFHVGSQCMEPLAWRRAIALAGETIRAAGVTVDVLDVGGGFPVRYPDLDPPPLGAFFAEIETAFESLELPATRLWAEPGRALVAAGTSVVVQVQMRRGNTLFVNDGVYGSLSDAGAPGFRFPARRIDSGLDRDRSPAEIGYSLFGPTCDSADHMKGPFHLPADIAEGDFIEIGQLGAYGACLRTGFNGFDRALLVEVRDAPMLPAAGHAGFAIAA